MSTNYLRAVGLLSLVLVLSAQSEEQGVPAADVPREQRGAPTVLPTAHSELRTTRLPGPAPQPEPVPEPTGIAAALPTAAAMLDEALEAHEAGVPASVPSRLENPPIATVKPLDAREDLLARAAVDPDTGRLVVQAEEGARTLTIEPGLQQKLTSILRSYETPFAAVVVMDPKTGRVLAMSEHSQADPSLRGLPLKAVFPAASIFKIVTATALLDAGLEKDTVECSQAAKRRLSLKHLEDSARDHQCMTLGQALGFSANGIFAKLTAKHLTRERLQTWAERFGFNRPFSFPMPADVSLAAFPEEPLAFAETGAGFGDVFMSPLHGAALAAVAATGGLWREPVLFEDELDTSELAAGAATDDGTGGAGTAAPEQSRVMSPERAAELTEMLEETVTVGTARRIFRERGFRVAGAVGKTGSLADKKPFRDYSWFVGFAPKDDPRVAVAAVIVNDPHWRIRATWLGREAMRLYLASLPQDVASASAAAR